VRFDGCPLWVEISLIAEAGTKPTRARCVDFTPGRFSSASTGNTWKNKGPR